MAADRAPACPLCAEDGGALVGAARVARDPCQRAGFPAFYRVVWNAHVAEFSDLSAEDRVHRMDAVTVVEQALRQHLAPPRSISQPWATWCRTCTGM